MSVLERCLYYKLKPVFDVFTRYIVEKKNWISRRKCEMVIRCRDRVVSRDSKIWVKLLSFGLELINRQVLYDEMVIENIIHHDLYITEPHWKTRQWNVGILNKKYYYCGCRILLHLAKDIGKLSKTLYRSLNFKFNFTRVSEFCSRQQNCVNVGYMFCRVREVSMLSK